MTTKRRRVIIALTIITFLSVLSYNIFNTYYPEKDRRSSSSPNRQLKQTQKTKADTPTPALPEVAWLISFPNSGTTYTQRLVQETSLTTVATFYGSEFVGRTGNGAFCKNSRPVFENVLEGPFRLSHLPLPEDGFVLSKTHCGGYGFSDTRPRGYVLNLERFVGECTHGARFEERDNEVGYEVIWFHYDVNIVRRAVHLFRDPFDNIVSRFHHEVHMNERKSPHLHWKVNFGNNAKGFREWCRYFDKEKLGKEKEILHEGIWRSFEGVPCHTEFFKYIQWHNNAFAATSSLNIKTHVIYYEDYGSNNADDIVNSLLEFLGRERKGSVPRFSARSYPEYYTDEERRKIVAMFFQLTSSETWRFLKRYVKDWIPLASGGA